MSGNRLTIAEGMLIVEPLGMDKAWSFTRRVAVPLSSVQGAVVDPSVIDDPKGLRWPGLHVPGKAVGTFYVNGARQFWNISGYHHAISITLHGERFDRLVLTVTDPESQVRAINLAITDSR